MIRAQWNEADRAAVVRFVAFESRQLLQAQHHIDDSSIFVRPSQDPFCRFPPIRGLGLTLF
jgi:hypothetical protein